ncbi:MAG: phosphate acyltransferase [Pseudomonadota bacterium]|nr:phosphate acyltransferase [Pseudomonadota bacterium]
MISSLTEVFDLARRAEPIKIAIIAPEDQEFMQAVKKAREEGLIDPVLLGNPRLISRAAEKVGLDYQPGEIIEIRDRQEVADRALQMLYQGDVRMVSKGQIPTSYIYRSIIRKKKEVGEGAIVSVITVWDIKNCDHLVLLTDAGANIAPNEAQKLEIVDNAINAVLVLGCSNPRVTELLSDSSNLQLKSDLGQGIKTPTIRNHKRSYNLTDATSLKDLIFTDADGQLNLNNLPNILLLPDLNTGNVVVKLDFFIKDITRVSFSHTERGPVLLPSRADEADSIYRELVFGAGLVNLQQRCTYE